MPISELPAAARALGAARGTGGCCSGATRWRQDGCPAPGLGPRVTPLCGTTPPKPAPVENCELVLPGAERATQPGQQRRLSQDLPTAQTASPGGGSVFRVSERIRAHAAWSQTQALVLPQPDPGWVTPSPRGQHPPPAGTKRAHRTGLRRTLCSPSIPGTTVPLPGPASPQMCRHHSWGHAPPRAHGPSPRVCCGGALGTPHP